MEITQELISRLRRELRDGLDEAGADPDGILAMLTVFDRALLNVVLPAAATEVLQRPGTAAGAVTSNVPRRVKASRKGKAASEAARRAWETRRRNKTGAKEPGPVVERIAGAGAVGAGAEGGAA